MSNKIYSYIFKNKNSYFKNIEIFVSNEKTAWAELHWANPSYTENQLKQNFTLIPNKLKDS